MAMIPCFLSGAVFRVRELLISSPFTYICTRPSFAAVQVAAMWRHVPSRDTMLGPVWLKEK